METKKSMKKIKEMAVYLSVQSEKVLEIIKESTIKLMEEYNEHELMAMLFSLRILKEVEGDVYEGIGDQNATVIKAMISTLEVKENAQK